MRWGWLERPGRAAIFGIIIACFFLPFVDVSCEQENSGGVIQTPDTGKIGRTGIDLVIGKRFVDDEELKKLMRGLVLGSKSSPQRTAKEPFAIIALMAALAGGWLAWSRRDRAAAICSGVGVGSMVLLGTSPSIALFGIAHVDLLFGYWLALGLFGLSLVLNVWFLRTSPSGRDPPDSPPENRTRSIPTSSGRTRSFCR